MKKVIIFMTALFILLATFTGVYSAPVHSVEKNNISSATQIPDTLDIPKHEEEGINSIQSLFIAIGAVAVIMAFYYLKQYSKTKYIYKPNKKPISKIIENIKAKKSGTVEKNTSAEVKETKKTTEANDVRKASETSEKTSDEIAVQFDERLKGEAHSDSKTEELIDLLNDVTGEK